MYPTTTMLPAGSTATSLVSASSQTWIQSRAPEHTPFPSHFPVSPQGVPAALGICVHTPAEHPSSVQGSLSSHAAAASAAVQAGAPPSPPPLAALEPLDGPPPSSALHPRRTSAPSAHNPLLRPMLDVRRRMSFAPWCPLPLPSPLPSPSPSPLPLPLPLPSPSPSPIY